VLTAGNPADFRSGGRYIVKVSRLGLGTDWVIVTFADIKEGLGGLERGQKAFTISLAVAIVLVISFTLYTVVVRVAFKNRLTNRYEVHLQLHVRGHHPVRRRGPRQDLQPSREQADPDEPRPGS
jgi:hypothetical protein